MPAINGIEYRFGKMDPRTQFHVARRLSPLLGTIVATIREGGMLDRVAQNAPEATEGGSEGGEAAKLKPALLALSDEDIESLKAMAQALADLDDASLDYILDKTLVMVERASTGGGFTPIMAKSGVMMFDDITMPAMLQLAWGVIQENLMGFFPGRP